MKPFARVSFALLALAAAAAPAAAAPPGQYRTEGDCAGFPRVNLKTAPGLCVGLVASHLGFARGVAAIGDAVYVADMGGWHSGKGRILRLAEGGHGKLEVVLGGLNQPNGMVPGPDGSLYVGESGRVIRFDPAAASPRQSVRVVLDGLAMPHSPRWHDGRLWVLNSGHGQLLRLDGRGGADVVCELPGYLRGLCFVNGYALIGLCKIRESNVFGGMPVQQRHAELLCGVAVVSLRSGKRVGTLSFTSGCTEIYDIRFLAGIHRPNIVNMGMEEARKGVDVPGLACWLPSDQKMRQAAEQRSDSQYNSP